MDDISKLIDERLWKEVKRNYLSDQYSNSVLDGIQFLGDLIREMSGEDGDGYNLMGRVFNTKNPKIKVNRLRTQTERDIQNGIMLLLQGFYRAIRNERVHEKKEDSEQEAYELILFLNHILRIVDQSRGKFTIENTLRRVFDDNFLPRDEYVNHIIDEIPASKKYEVAVEVFRNRQKSRRDSDLAIFWNLLKKDLKPKELEDIRNEISETLRYSEEREEVISVIYLIGEDWNNLDNDSRLRAENLLIRSLPSYLSDDPREGPYGYQFVDIANALYQLYIDDSLVLKKEFSNKIFSMLEKSSTEMTEFIISNFGGILKELDEYNSLLLDLDEILIKKLKSGEKQLITFIDRNYTEERAFELKEYLPKPSTSNFDDMDDDLPF